MGAGSAVQASKTEEQASRTAEQTIKTFKNIQAHLKQLKNDGKSQATIDTANQMLTRLAALCDINEPEIAKEKLSELKWLNSTKHNAVNYLSSYYNFLNIEWKRPKYKQEEQTPFIPTEEEIDILIASCSKKIATILSLLKDTGARIGEIHKTKWIDIDIQRKTISIKAEKGSNGRILPISEKSINLLNLLPKETEKVFNGTKRSIKSNFEWQRKHIANKISNPRLKAIHFHTLRHWKGTIEYHKTKDILHVKTTLGHKSITSTMIYINIESALWLQQSDEYISKIAHNETEELQLIELGFEHISDRGENHFYRKRK